MKKSIFIILPLILWAFAACDNDDSEWDSGNLGVNSVEGTWQRVGAYPKVLAIFGSDYTSTIQTVDGDDFPAVQSSGTEKCTPECVLSDGDCRCPESRGEETGG